MTGDMVVDSDGWYVRRDWLECMWSWYEWWSSSTTRSGRLSIEFGSGGVNDTFQEFNQHNTIKENYNAMHTVVERVT